MEILSKNDSLNELIKDFEATRLLAVGEIHGVKENADLYRVLIEKLDINTIALEYPVSSKDPLINYFKTGGYPNHYAFKEISDGRVNKEMLEMLKELYNSGQIKNIICFDPEVNTSHWNERDKAYAENFLKEHNRFNNPRTLIVAGKLHTHPTPFTLDKSNKAEQGELYSMIYHLIQDFGHFPILHINYSNGSFYNFEVKRIEDDKKFSLVENHMLTKTDRYFYEFMMKGFSSVNEP